MIAFPPPRDEDIARIFPPAAVEMLRRAAGTWPRNEEKGTSDRTRAVNDVIRKLHHMYPHRFRREALNPD